MLLSQIQEYHYPTMKSKVNINLKMKHKKKKIENYIKIKNNNVVKQFHKAKFISF